MEGFGGAMRAVLPIQERSRQGPSQDFCNERRQKCGIRATGKTFLFSRVSSVEGWCE